MPAPVERKPAYPPEWKDHWFDHGRPSLEAKVAAWGVLIKVADREAAKKAEEQVA